MKRPKGNANDWQAEHDRVVEALKSKLASKETCAEAIDGFQGLVGSIREFIKTLLGNAGAKAVLNRALKMAAEEAPLVKLIRTTDVGVDFADFRLNVLQMGCTSAEVVESLIQLGVMVFQTLSELAGDALTEPLISRLEQPDQ